MKIYEIKTTAKKRDTTHYFLTQFLEGDASLSISNMPTRTFPLKAATKHGSDDLLLLIIDYRNNI